MKPTKPVKVKVHRLPHGAGLAMPAYQSKDAAGLDLQAAIAAAEPLTLMPGQRALVPTGLAIELPEGTEAQVRPRSGLATKHGVTVLNSPGTIDADYRGEIKVILINHGEAPFLIQRADRIAQMVIAHVIQAKLSESLALTETGRGSGGFGSTGTRSITAKPVGQQKRKVIARKAQKTKSASAKRRPR